MNTKTQLTLKLHTYVKIINLFWPSIVYILPTISVVKLLKAIVLTMVIPLILDRLPVYSVCT